MTDSDILNGLLLVLAFSFIGYAFYVLMGFFFKSLLKFSESNKRYETILKIAEEVLGNHDRAIRWLSTPASALDNTKPVDLLETEEGFQRVEKLLMMQIEHSDTIGLH